MYKYWQQRYPSKLSPNLSAYLTRSPSIKSFLMFINNFCQEVQHLFRDSAISNTIKFNS